MSTSIKLGFVGLSATHSWASRAHLPALKNLEPSPYRITGLVNSSFESANISKDAHGLRDARPYDSVEKMVAEADKASAVDVVVVSVKVPHHYSLIRPALEAGKDVFSEWPLGNGLEEAEELAKLARDKGVKTAVTMQARKAPPILKAKQLVDSGVIGRVLSTTFIAHGSMWSQFFREGSTDYLLHEKNGANLMTIPGGHDLDALAYVLGEFESLSATVKTQLPTLDLVKPSENGKMIKTGSQITKDIADQILVHGTLTSGVTASIHLRATHESDLTKGEQLHWEIHGTNGDILISSSSCLAEMSELKIQLGRWDDAGNALGVQDLSEKYDPIVGNVQDMYKAFATKPTGIFVPPQYGQAEGFPTFDDAVIRHRMIDAIYKSSKTGTRQSYKTTV
ncbi:hypothetical protein BZG36_05440 [Bifiguratus adelaidae]|uniref:Gfo/Idh/MocA-like oxidoreductase N-terminal domain-containing protein n=1 Tax=Bifiguratus adelaidae TaxID=1938954 RepID=A0A261XTS1_9FUNG|nr:hypothetical protein BZG36_05440 [Bifiguratus adelaidae]